MTIAQLIEFADTVNDRVEDCIPEEYDRLFLDILDECGIDEHELVTCGFTETGDDFYAFKAEGKRMGIIHYASGRVALVSGWRG